MENFALVQIRNFWRGFDLGADRHNGLFKEVSVQVKNQLVKKI